MKKLIDYLLLPKSVSEFERNYLAKMNRVGFGFFAAHLPIMAAIAFFNGTGALFAALSTVVVLVGPLVALRTFENPRAVSMVYGFTAMAMGGLLVHFGQGPVQIEMHFYFFVLIALLAVYANPLVIVVAAVTAAVHHLVLWLVLPGSVFNYAAPVWVVAVHALFGVLESVAACFIARSFFDNVIGLEKIVAARTSELDQRNQDMRVVLDNVDQVLLTLDKQAVVGAETSQSARSRLGEDLAQRSLQEVLRGNYGGVADDFAMGWEQLTDGFLPAELALEQLPSRLISADGKTLRLEYKAIEEQGELSRVLVVGTDVTAELSRSRLEEEQKETMAIFDRVMRDKRGFLDFFSEAEQLVEAVSSVREGDDLPALKRRIHTLKGNAAIFNLSTIAHCCHELETAMEEECRFPTEAEQAELGRRWRRVQANLEGFLGNRRVVEIRDDQFTAILRALLARRPHDEVAQMVSRFKLDRASDRLQRFAEQASRLAKRLGKAGVEVSVDCDEFYFDPVAWSPFWASFVHSVRNAVDHGIESPEEREATGKTATGHITLSAKLEKQEVVIAIADDGRGIDWKALGERAKDRGIHCKTREELIEALFLDGVSTAETVSEVSGRGVGMGALREACHSLGGYLEVPFVEGPGTIIEFHFPRKSLEVDPTAVLERHAA